jgi:hypothetical protein
MREGTSRREFIGLTAGLAAAIAGCDSVRIGKDSIPSSLSLPVAGASDAFRFWNRASFGPRPGDVAALSRSNREAVVEKLLAAEEPESPILFAKLGRIDVLRMDGMELFDLPREEIIRQLQQAALLRAIYGRNQLLERMVDFWSNHFNIYARKTDGMYFVAADSEKVIRKHALGKFRELLLASAKSPAMLHYLDNNVNRKGVPNENYARELLELHTMGVEGGYTQKDVQEVARCLTGWTIETRFLRPRGKFRFDALQHDDGEKRVLGHRIAPGGGIKDGEAVIDILSSHPSTAKFIATKLCRYFLGDAAGAWIDRTSNTFIETGGDIRAMLRPILLSRELIDSPPLIKRPFDFVVSTLRALDADTDAGLHLQRHLDSMGQPLYQWPMPDGYPDTTDAWTGTMLARWKFAMDLVGRRIAGTNLSLESLIGRGADWSEILLASHDGWTAGGDRETVTLLLCSPAFQWR